MLLNITIPHEPFNTLVRNGTVGGTLDKIMKELKPEAAYFTEQDGARGAILVVNVEHPSQVPTFAEPWFLHFNADVKFRVAMTPDDLAKSGLDAIAKKWS
jgi:hypothetical protein